jgi:hypothetical protein
MVLSTSTFQRSTPKFRGPFQNIPIDLSKIDRPLADAVRQRAALIADRSETADLPLLVAIFLDQFVAEYVFAYPRSFDERDASFREISGILTIEPDVARNAAFKKLSDEEQKRRLKSGDMSDLPPHSTDFVLVPNQAAIRGVPEDFERRCPPDAYYG